ANQGLALRSSPAGGRQELAAGWQAGSSSRQSARMNLVSEVASFSPAAPDWAPAGEHSPPLPYGLTKSEIPRSPNWAMRATRGREAHSSGQKKRGGQLRGTLGHYAVGRRGSSEPREGTVVLGYYTRQ